MKSNLLVSILIPCYNHELFLDDCLSSILAQDYDNIELLICDDCSPDNSYEKIRSYEVRLRERFSRVEIMRNEVNCGVTKNINRMLALAKGVYVKTIASDDAMAPDAIRAMVSYLQEHPAVGVVVSNGLKVSEDQHYPDFESKDKIYHQPPNFSMDGFFERTARCNEISAPAAMVRMAVYEKYGNYDEQVKVEDYEFWLRILKDGKVRFGFLDAELLYYRISGNSMTSLTGNAGLARRRKLIHDSEIDTLHKYSAYLDKAVFADIVLNRIFSELWLAVEYSLPEWEGELRCRWHDFPGWKDLPVKEQVILRLRSGKQRLKKIMRWRRTTG